ncbi:MAG: Transcriptional regulator TetR family [Comamonadaceae bacterium]|nr:MAG: Transcriptional regulator TetR family [Comamonadaceae bacterium]
MTQDIVPPLQRAPREARPDRRYAILLAAEKLFAQRGYSGVSIRQIADEAKVPLALVGYYFGPKHELFRAIFEHWNSTIQERLDALATVRTHAAEPGYLEQVVNAFISPVLRLRASPEGQWYALLMTRGINEPLQETDQIMRQYFDPMAHAFIDALQDAFAGSTRGQVAWAYQFMLGALLHHISDERVQRLSNDSNTPNDPAAAPLLAAFITGGMRQVMAMAFAPTSPAP